MRGEPIEAAAIIVSRPLFALIVSGGTSPGAALNVLMDEIDTHVARGTADRKGDSKPVVFPMTDACPTDRPVPGIARWRSDYAAAVFAACCQHSETPCLMRFEQSGGRHLVRADGRHVLRPTIALEPSYFHRSADVDAPAGRVITADLSGAPGCLPCGAPVGMVSCQCGRLHCLDGERVAICPWCGRRGIASGTDGVI